MHAKGEREQTLVEDFHDVCVVDVVVENVGQELVQLIVCFKCAKCAFSSQYLIVLHLLNLNIHKLHVD